MELDCAVDSELKVIKSDAQGKSLSDKNESDLRGLLAEVLGMKSYDNDLSLGTSLLLSLNAPSPMTRSHGLKIFADVMPDDSDASSYGDFQGLTGSVIQCLVDSSMEVAKAAWDPRTLQKILKISSKGQFVQAAVSAFDFWVGHASTSPSKCAKMLGVILDSLKDTNVSDSLFDVGSEGALVTGTETDRNKITEWVLCVIVTCLCGLQLPVMYKARTEALQQAAFQCMEHVAPSIGGMGEFTTSSGRTVGNTSDVRINLIGKVIAGSSHSSTAYPFRTVIKKAFLMLTKGEEKSGIYLVNGCLQILQRICIHFYDNGEIKNEPAQIYLNDLVTLLIVCALNSGRLSDHIEIDVVGSMLAVFEMLRGGKLQKSSKEYSLQELVRLVTSPIHVSDLPSRILAFLLSTKSPELASLVGKCLQTCFTHDPSIALLRLAFKPYDTRAVNVDQWIDELEDNAEYQIDARMRVGSLQALESMVRSIGSVSVKTNNVIKEQASILLLCCI